MPKFWIIAAAALSISTVMASSAIADQTRIGVAAEPYPPFSVPDSSGNWSGWEIDLAQALCAEAKLDCAIVPIPWDGLIPALQTNKIDLIMSSMSITEERKKQIGFSAKYYNTPAVVIAAKTSAVTTAPEALAGKVIGVQAGTIHAAYVRAHFPGAAEVKDYQTQDEAWQDLAAGRIDAVQADLITATAFLKSSPGAGCCDSKGTVPADEAILGSGVGAGARKDDQALLDKIDAAIADLRANGAYTTLSRKYFDFDIYGTP